MTIPTKILSQKADKYNVGPMFGRPFSENTDIYFIYDLISNFFSRNKLQNNLNL